MRITSIPFRYLLTSWLVCMAYFPVYTQEALPPPEFQFEKLELPYGELGNHVQAVGQDSLGMMWFGTQFGLHRWDGYQFTTYFHDPANEQSLSSSYIEEIYVASDGKIWLGTWGGGVSCFDPITQRYVNYLHSPTHTGTISSNFVSKIVEDPAGHLWIATMDGLNRLNPKTGIVTRFMPDPRDPTSLAYHIVRELYVDSEGTLWVGAGWPWEESKEGGLHRYDPATQSFIRFQHIPGDPSSLRSNKVLAIQEDSRGNFWIGTSGDGLHRMNRETGTFEHFPQNGPHKLSAPYSKHQELYVKFIFEDQDSNLWIGSWAGGLRFFDPDTGYSHLYTEGSMPETIPDNWLWNMFQTRDGTLWAWTANTDAKIFQIKKIDQLFHYLRFPSCSQVLDICKDGNRYLYASTKNGLYQWDLQTREQRVFQDEGAPPQTSFHFPVNDNRYNDQAGLFEELDQIECGPDGRVWFAKAYQVYSTGIFSFFPESGEVRHYENGSRYTTHILRTQSGDIWAAYHNGSIGKYLPEQDAFQYYGLPGYNSDSDDLYMAMVEDSNGVLWIGFTGKQGSPFETLHLFSFNPLTEQFKEHKLLNPTNPTAQQLLSSIDIAPDGTIWLLTRNVLQQYDPKTGKGKIFDPRHFGSEEFNGLAIDAYGTLWITAQGLIHFDPEKGKSFTYNESAGIRVTPFTPRSIVHFRFSDGAIAFGGKEGINSLQPADFQNTDQPIMEVALTEFRSLTNSRHTSSNLFLTSEFRESGEIRVPHSENVFSIRFAGLDYSEPESNRHEFQLLGYDYVWRETGLEPIATYIKVPPGSYEFRVRAANTHGIWSPIKSFSLIILPPWWLTWWAYTLYAIVLGSLAYWFYRFQLNRKLDQAEAVRLRELDTVKTRLYTNITHEFRTPITVILGMARQVQENPKAFYRQGLDMIVRNGEHLLGLVNQMLDLSKLESGKMKLNPRCGDVVPYLKYLSESYQSFAAGQDVRLHFLSELDSFRMDYDAEKLQQIMSNLLTNAVKFTPDEGDVYVTVDAMDHPDKSGPKQLCIRVKDTGRGIPEEQLPYIFDRFYQVDDSEIREGEGSGIGLSLTRELLHLMGGTVSVRSRPGQGSEFTVLLPVSRVAEPMVEEELPPIETTIKQQVNAQISLKTEDIPGSQAGAKLPVVLIVEDNRDVVQYISSCLAGSYQLLIATDGQAGVATAMEQIPDLVITDVMMPRKDGFAVCSELKNDPKTSHIPVIMLTAKADVESKLEGLEHGADAYLAKPFHKEELRLRIRKLLELRCQLQKHYQRSLGIIDEAHPETDIPSVGGYEDAFVREVRSVVEDHLDDYDFTVEQLCREIALSNSQLHRKLSAVTGLSATKFIRYIRLTKAKEMLRQSEYSVTAVAFDTGFSDPSYFGRVFKQEFGLTPVEWREREMAT